jgi:hypothetical protein
MSDKQLESKVKEIMRFYVTNYMDPQREKLKGELRKLNVLTDPEFFDMQIDNYIDNLEKELVDKFHAAATLIIDSIVAGRENKVREFELLFIDLAKRTLVNDIKQEKSRPEPIVIIADPNVDGELH